MAWALPVRGGYRTSGYGPRTSPGGIGTTYHRGVDVGGRGTDWLVRSVGPGSVLATGNNTIRGRWVAVRHNDGTTTAYQHLNSVLVSRGQPVDGGTPLGVMGTTGSSTARHLHMEAFPAGRFLLSGTAWATTDRAVDPEPYLRARGVNLATGTVTVNNPTGGTGGGNIPDVNITPITPLEEDMPLNPNDLAAVRAEAREAVKEVLRSPEFQGYLRDVPIGPITADIGGARISGSPAAWLADMRREVMQTRDYAAGLVAQVAALDALVKAEEGE